MNEERMFVDPETGDMHPESYYRMENIDLDTLLEAVEMDGDLAFEIKVQNLERMNIKHPVVFAIFADFCQSMREAAEQAESDDDRETFENVAAYTARVMLQKLGKKVTQH
jgi:hypothetical protein